MNYRMRYVLFFIIDSCIVLSAIYMSYWLLHPTINGYSDKVILISAVTLLVSHHIAAYFFHLYDRIWSVASVRELLTITYAVTISIVTASCIQYIIKNDVYFRVMVITWMLHIIMIGGSRFLLRVLNDRESFRNTANLKRVLIVGAGQGGTMLAKNLLHAPNPDRLPIAFVDDDQSKQQLKVMNLTVAGTTKNIPKLVANYGIDEIIIAIPSLGRIGIQSIYKDCAKTNLPVKVMPSIEDVMTGKVAVNEMKEVQIEDLLGRDEVKLDMIAISNKLTDKVILVTGAGGSIGSEICRQVMSFQPKKLILLGHGENSIYTIHMELIQRSTGTELIPIIADIQDRERIFEVVEQYQPDVIYHAAAHKHVPLMEYNPNEAVKNNIFGTKNVAEAAHEFDVKNFVMISTDKAVNPPNIMGATKRIAEMVVQNLAKNSKTKFAAVRFGNVLGSRGSVIPLFKKQIVAGGPVTVTHPDMTRYFMTIPEASRLVLQAGTLGGNGEIFVLDMGEPVKIVDLARNLIQLSGFKEDEIKIEFSGLRPGEKMYEELLNKEEIQKEHVFPGIHIGLALPLSSYYLNNFLEEVAFSMDECTKKKLIEIANNKFIKEYHI
ncbi:polysaccharide biosynthesis protein [Lysinibacillus fusiformis]|uniref:polysaccharide biosynthesis protein n=1 Tax=Lysinibacillus fusiformis TaxID=28031 RepID=UPI00263BA9B1|nr:nucleoside-diphosphate sugar epimerase/dehydratase [Lysinibacillus fusiformis]MDC6270272.1 nucleoside-diphosphate sugar epimerase/dehydratase [Lysinibacillus sphaericus]MDN4971675.1 nucleoside-diphosphate sugar epimerase/dehydratase [Lysinibacillus fusiformis]